MQRRPVMQAVAGMVGFEQPLTGDFEPRQVMVGGVTPNVFGLLGVRPALGRDFRPADGDPLGPDVEPGDPGAANNIAILSHGLWERRFGADPAVVGRIVEIGGTPHEIVGVMPEGFVLHQPPESTLPSSVDVWVALRLDYDNAPRNNVFLTVLGRRRPDVSVADVQADMHRLASELRELDPVWSTAGYEIDVIGLQEDLTAHVRPIILALVGAVAFVLLIACANVSNLLLIRASSRERELAVRSALGGSRGRIVRQLLSESLLLAGAGAILGVALAAGGIDLLVALQPGDLPRMDEVGIDGAVLAFTGLATVLAAVVFGLVPAVRASRPDLAAALKDRGSSADLATSRLLRNGVVVAEVGLSLALLIGAGLMVRSFVELQRTDPGFDPGGVLTFGIQIPQARYPDIDQRVSFATVLQDRLAGLPGVTSVSAGVPLPLEEGLSLNGRWGLEDALADAQAFRQADYHAVLPGFFETLGTRMLAGRSFTRAEYEEGAAVAVIDRTLAEIAFPDRSLGDVPGERILVRVTTPDPVWVDVIGVVEPQRNTSLAEEGRETVYFNDKYFGSFGVLTWAVRTGADPMALGEAVRAEVAALDPLIPVDNLQPMTAFLDRHLVQTRFSLTLIAVFGAIALTLAAVGLYGVLAYAVRQRTAEIGVRMAFGAETGSILRLVVGQGMALSALGVGVGLVLAFGLSGVMSTLVVGISATDPVTFGSVSLIFLTVAAVACLVPAWRAARTDPVRALREE
jgi:putative ABC transport system permease protein